MNGYLKSALRQFKYYESLGSKAMAQVEDEKLFSCPDEESNSIAVIVKHLHGNMLSRWTNFLTEDGEKSWRDRDGEFLNDLPDAATVKARWEEGWACLYNALGSITDADLDKIVYIRNEGHSILEAINRQLCHYSYHIGQIVYLAKLLRRTDWESLSIPRNKSANYNRNKFDQDKGIRHFTDNV